MALSILFKTSRVSLSGEELKIREPMLTKFTEKKKDWSLSEWITNFLEDEGLPYDEEYLDDMYDGTLGDDNEDILDGVVESTLIIGITLALVLLLWWRQRMQQQHAQNVEGERQNQRQQQGNPMNPEDAFPAWAGGGMGL
jgi:SEL1 protein